MPGTPNPSLSFFCPTLHPLPSFPLLRAATVGDAHAPPPKLVWPKLTVHPTEAQKVDLARLPRKTTNRCRALIERLICLDLSGEDLRHLLFLWVSIMKPRRADWLVVLKELHAAQNPLYPQVMELACVDESFEPNIRDYTKLIDYYGKQNRLADAEKAFALMKERGFIYDQITLTVLVQMYSKAGCLELAEEKFEELKSLGVPLDKRSYGSMIMAYIRADQPNQGELLLMEMDSLDVYAGSEVYKALLRSYSLVGNAGSAHRVFQAMQLAGIVPDTKHCALLINAYVVSGQSENASVVLENSRNAGIPPSDKCIALILTAYENDNKLSEAMSLLLDLEKDGLVLGKEASQVLAKWFRKIGVVHEIERVLQEYSAMVTGHGLHSQ